MKFPKAWIMRNNLSEFELRAIQNGAAYDDFEIISETEKAVKFKIHTDYGNIWLWCPKSQLQDTLCTW